MNAHVELSIGSTEAYCTLVTRRRVARLATMPVDEHTELDACIHSLLTTVPRRRWRRPRVRVVLGGRWRQVRRIEGLPPLDDVALATQVVRENADAFFLATPGGLKVANLERDADGTVWGAAFDGADVGRLERAIRETRSVLISIAADRPADDGDTRHRSLILHAPPRRFSPPFRRAIALGALLIAGLVAFATPGLHATLMLRATDSREEVERLRLATDLRRLQAELRALQQLDGERSSISNLLVDVTTALPDYSAITSLRIDSASVTIAIVSDRLDAALDHLEALDGLSDLTVVGATMLDRRGGEIRQRATVKLARRSWAIARTRSASSRATRSGVDAYDPRARGESPVANADARR